MQLIELALIPATVGISQCNSIQFEKCCNLIGPVLTTELNYIVKCPQCAMFYHPAPYLIHKFYELVCVCPSMTKVSHGCGWCFLPAVVGWSRKLRFIVDIIIWHYPFYSDWLTELPIFSAYQDQQTSPRRVVRSLLLCVQYHLISWREVDD